MSKLSQKDGVFAAVTSYLKDQDRQLVDGQPVSLSKEDSKTLIGMIAMSIQEGLIEVSEAKMSTMVEDADYRKYASNLLNNWTRKDLRLNGGEKYETQNPGSRAGAGDETIKALKTLRASLTDDDQIEEVSKAIVERLALLKAERTKTKVKEVNFDLIPEFAHLIK